MRDDTMAKFTSDYQFVRCTLGKSEKEQFTRWFELNEKKLGTALSNVLEGGYKVSFSADFENSCFVCTLTGNEEKSPNYKKMLSSRAEDHWEALGLCIFKHVEMFNGEKWDSEGSNWG
jgi:hypothetical protein